MFAQNASNDRWLHSRCDIFSPSWKRGWDEGCGPQPCGVWRKWPAVIERLDSTGLILLMISSCHVSRCCTHARRTRTRDEKHWSDFLVTGLARAVPSRSFLVTGLKISLLSRARCCPGQPDFYPVKNCGTLQRGGELTNHMRCLRRVPATWLRRFSCMRLFCNEVKCE